MLSITAQPNAGNKVIVPFRAELHLRRVLPWSICQGAIGLAMSADSERFGRCAESGDLPACPKINAQKIYAQKDKNKTNDSGNSHAVRLLAAGLLLAFLLQVSALLITTEDIRRPSKSSLLMPS
jgi:hypothetical protein